jgi:hypothetical protein
MYTAVVCIYIVCFSYFLSVILFHLVENIPASARIISRTEISTSAGECERCILPPPPDDESIFLS